MKITLIAAIFLLASTQSRATELILRPIGLKLSVDLKDWASPNWQPPEHQPAEMEIQSNESPDHFEFVWGKDGKSKVFTVKTSRLRPGKKYAESDLAQYEAELGHDGFDPKEPGVHDEIASLLGHPCFKQTAQFSDSRNKRTTKSLMYVLYAQGLRYVITAVTYGYSDIAPNLSPEEDPVLKSLIASLAFLKQEPNKSLLPTGNSPATSKPKPPSRPAAE